MVILCPQCRTRFKLADEKIKPGGIKVRCSKCRKVFSVVPPEPPEAPIAAPPPPSPEPSADLAGSDIFAEEAFGDAPETSSVGEEPHTTDAVNEPPAGDTPAPEENRIFFQDDAPAYDEEMRPFEEERPTEQPAESPFESWNEEKSSTFSLDESDHFSDEDGEFSWDGEEADAFDFSEPASPPFTDQDSDFGEITFAEEPPLSSPAETAADLEAGPERTEAEPQLLQNREELVVPEGERPPPPPPRLAARRSNPFRTLLLCIFLLLLILSGTAAYFYWNSGLTGIERLVSRWSSPRGRTSATSGIHLQKLTGFFITNRDAGQLFVVNGEAINDSSEARSAILVKGVLYDKSGHVQLQKTVYCGNPLTEKDLRSLPFSKIESAMSNQFGDSLSNLNVAKGEMLPFTIVFRNLPPDLAEYTVEVVDSQPGSRQ